MATVTANTTSPARKRRATALLVLIPLFIIVVIFAIGSGAVVIAPMQVVSILLSYVGIEPVREYTELQATVLHAIRLPRVLLGALVGAGLAVSGAAMQGLFRNPLADPGLLGITSGASVAAAATIVLGLTGLGIFTLPVAAFLGSLATTALIYFLSQDGGRLSVATMLLAGIAVNALGGAATGLFTFLATDDQLRTITFWNLGSLGGATWQGVLTAGPFIVLCIIGMPLMANALDALLLGEGNARHLGISVDRVKWTIVTLVALGVGAGVAVSGSIGFVGLVVPHLVRLWIGPNHRALLPASALLGATLLVLADLFARTIVVPAELPIGIVTALVGAPFFLFLLLKGRKNGRLT